MSLAVISSFPEFAASILTVKQNIYSALRICSANTINGDRKLGARHLIYPGVLRMRSKQYLVKGCNKLVAFHDGHANQDVAGGSGALITNQADASELANAHNAK